MSDESVASGERTSRFRRAVRKNGGRRLDVALDGASLAALDVVRVRRGLPYPRQVFVTLLAEEKARLENAAQPERPEVTALNAGVVARSILSCLPATEAERQRVLADFLTPMLRAAIEAAHANGERLSLLRLLAYVPLDDATVERVRAAADSTDVSAATRRALGAQAAAWLARGDRETYYELLEAALETMLWNGLVRG